MKGQVVFPSLDALVAGLGDTKLSIVFPSSMTHPGRSGHVETVTHKYFESMASRCVLVGHCPDELHDLFGYNPVIEVDWSDPAGHVRTILENLDAHVDLVERNFSRLLDVGTWDTRVQTLVAIFRNRVGFLPNSFESGRRSPRDDEVGASGLAHESVASAPHVQHDYDRVRRDESLLCAVWREENAPREVHHEECNERGECVSHPVECEKDGADETKNHKPKDSAENAPVHPSFQQIGVSRDALLLI